MGQVCLVREGEYIYSPPYVVTCCFAGKKPQLLRRETMSVQMAWSCLWRPRGLTLELGEKTFRWVQCSPQMKHEEYAWVKHDWSIHSSIEFVKQPLLKKSSWWVWFLRDSVSRAVGVPQKTKQGNRFIYTREDTSHNHENRKHIGLRSTLYQLV